METLSFVPHKNNVLPICTCMGVYLNIFSVATHGMFDPSFRNFPNFYKAILPMYGVPFVSKFGQEGIYTGGGHQGVGIY